MSYKSDDMTRQEIAWQIPVSLLYTLYFYYTFTILLLWGIMKLKAGRQEDRRV
jgi:hypothetical protein